MAFGATPACADVRVVTEQGVREVVVVPKRKKVAMVGFATNTLHLVPWTDPTFEIWSMNQGHLHCQRRTDRHFEMHQPEATADVRDPGYLDFLRTCPIPVYMIQQIEEYPTSIRYPIEAAIALTGRDYFMSSVAYMIALALLEGFSEIHLYGINLAIGDEYFYEKPNAEWWIGHAEARGVTVYVPGASSLLKQFRRYGYHTDARPSQSLKVLVQARINEYRSRAERTQCDLNQLIGAMREDESLLQIVEGVDHGADVVLMPSPPPPTT